MTVSRIANETTSRACRGRSLRLPVRNSLRTNDVDYSAAQCGRQAAPLPLPALLTPFLRQAACHVAEAENGQRIPRCQHSRVCNQHYLTTYTETGSNISRRLRPCLPASLPQPLPIPGRHTHTTAQHRNAPASRRAEVRFDEIASLWLDQGATEQPRIRSLGSVVQLVRCL
jgi:hypothetical protein